MRTHCFSTSLLCLSRCTLLLACTSSAAWGDNLIWNDGTANFTGSPTWDYDDNGAVVTTDNPFTHAGTLGPGGNGANIVFLGNGGDVTLSSTSSSVFGSNGLLGARVGTLNPAANLSGIGGQNLQGDGTLTIAGSTSLLLADPTEDDTTNDGLGDLIVGGASGITGVLNQNSSGTINAQGAVRVGQGGVGTFNQNGGLVKNGEILGPAKFMAVGGAGGTGTYNLNSGTLELGAQFGGFGFEVPRRLIVGIDPNSTGTLNIGDGSGPPSSAVVQTWDEVDLGEFGATDGVIHIHSDGELRANFGTEIVNAGGSAAFAEAKIRIGLSDTGGGTIIQDGGTLHTDSRLLVGVGTGVGLYDINGPGSTIEAQALSVGTNGTLDFGFTSGGASKITLQGSQNTAGDDELGIDLATGAMLMLTDFASYTSSADVLLIDSLDPTATISGQFAGLNQGDSIGFANGGATEFFINYFGGTDNNDVLLQTSVTNSLTDGLVWNAGAANFGAGGGWARSDGSFGVAASGVNPFGAGEDLYLGNNGVATLNSSGAVQRLSIGTNQASNRIAGTNGDGTLNASGSTSLTVTGDLTVGSGGFTGTVQWGSTGTLATEGKFRVGEGGIGVFTQTAGTVTGGDTAGPQKFLGIGSTTGSTGTYHLNSGTLAPAGGLGATERRNLRVGDEGGVGTLNLGDGLGGAATALIESNDDLFIGRNGGTGVVNIASDGAIRLVTDGPNPADFFVGLNGGGNGTVIQTGGSVETDATVGIGQNNDAVGVYTMTGGSFTNGAREFHVGSAGGTGTLSVGGDASFSHEGNFFIAHLGNTGATGTLELIGSNASFSLAQLENAPGNNETIRWIADAAGITTIEVAGTFGAGDFVQIQDPTELAANTGSPGSLMGDGIALELDLSALSGDHTLRLIDNRSAEAIVGFFEDGATGDLFEEGESILGTGYNGVVNISYSGGTGNDVVLDLIASAGNPSDLDSDGDVDGRDFLLIQRTNPSLISTWESNYGVGTPTSAAGQLVPEPATLCLLIGIIAAWGSQSRQARARRTT